MTAARAIVAIALVYVVVVLGIALARRRVLGHDEAVYAIGARGLVDDARADDYPLHRSIGMRALALPGVALGGGERAVRLPFALIALAYLAAVHRLARRRFDARTAALALAVVATTSAWQWRAAEALSDIPAALALLGLVGLCTGPPTWRRALAAAGCAAAACYLRYASAPVVAVIFAAAYVGDPARRRWLIAVTAGALVALAPFFAWSCARTGSLFGALRAGEHMGHREYVGAGLVFYLRSWPVTLVGPVTGAVAAIGVAVGLAAWGCGLAGATTAERTRRLLATAAVGQLVLLGWRVHGEPRYVFFAMTALAIAGASWLAAQRPRWRIAIAAVALTAIPSAVWTLTRLDRLASSRVAFAQAAAVIHADAAGADCVVFATEVPMTIWYTRCRTEQVDGWGLDPARAAGAAAVYLLEAHGLPRSIGAVEETTRAVFHWQPLACAPGWCVWRATPAAP